MLTAGAGVPPATISSLAKSLVLVTPTILVPPYSADGAFPIPGIPEPGTNYSTAELRLSGGFRPDADGVSLVIEAANQRGSLSAIKLRRVGTDAGLINVRTTFKRWPTTSSFKFAAPQGELTPGAWTVQDAPELLTLDGALYSLHLAKNPASTDSWLVARNFDERLHEDWQHYAASGSLETLLGADITPQSFCALADGGNIYGIVFATQASVGCRFYVLRLHGTAWSVVGSSQATGGDALTGGASACSLPSGGFLVAFTKLIGTASPYRFDVQYALSKNLQGWGEDATSGLIQAPKIADVKTAVRVVIPGTNRIAVREKILKVRMVDADFGWALTTNGQIVATGNGGVSWWYQTVPTPTTAARPWLFNVAGAKVGSVYYGYAVGAGGLIMRTQDSGVTWKVLRYGAASVTATYAAGDRVPTSDPADFTAPDSLYGVAVQPDDQNTAYVCGADGTLAYTVDGGATWVWKYATATTRVGTGDLEDVIADTYGTIFVVGAVDGFSNIADSNGANAALIRAAATGSGEYVFHDIGSGAHLRGCACPFTGTSIETTGANYIYIVSVSGDVFRRNGTGVEQLPSLLLSSGGQARAADIAAYGTVLNAAQKIAIAGERGRLWICENADNQISTESTPVANSPQFNSYELGFKAAFSVAFPSADSLLVGTFSQVARVTTISADRCYPRTFVTRAGSVLAIDSNITRGEIEVFRGVAGKEAEMPQFVQVLGNGIGEHLLTFGRVNPVTEADFSNTLKSIPRASITQDDLGNLILCAGASGTRVSVDDGKNWLKGGDTSLAIPTDVLETSVTYSNTACNQSRRIHAYGSRIFGAVLNGAVFNSPVSPFVSVAVSGAIATFVAREWDATGTHALPVPADRGAHLIDGVNANLFGAPSPGDTWTIAPDYRYPPRNFVCQESPKHFWRGPSKSASVVLTPERVILFDAGVGKLFPVTHFYAYGCNFQRVKFAVSNPGDDSEWTEYDSLSSLISGYAAAISINSGSVVRDSALTSLRAHRLAFPADAQPTANRPCYLSMNDIEGAWRCFRVVDNDENGAGGVNYQLDLSPLEAAATAAAAALALTPEATAAFVAAALTPAIPGLIATAYEVWQGSHYWNGVGGTGPGSAGLAGSPYGWCRYVRITIPEQPTAEGYFRGNLLAGVGLDPQPPAGSTDWARSIAPGFSFGLTPNSVEVPGLDGVSALEHFDQGEAIACQIQAAPDWYVERFNALLSRNRKMRQAMCAVFDSADANSARLMRLVDGPSHVQAARNYHNIEFAMRGVA